MPRPENEPILVVLPSPDGRIHGMIDPASGIVGWGVAGDRMRIWYEGNRYGYENVKNFADRCAIACSRAVADYPTVATLSPMRDDVHVVGVYDYDAGCVRINAEDQRRLAEWIGVPIEDLAGELLTTSRIR